MNKELVPELRFPEFGGEWEEKKLGEVAEITMGQSPSSKGYNNKKKGMPLVQGNADIKNRKTKPQVYTEQITRTCDIADLILTVRAPVGHIAVSIHKACIGRGVCSLKSKNNDFIFYNLLQNEKQWKKYEQGSTFTSINSDVINTFKLVVPIKKEQEKIGKFFYSIDKKLELQEKKIANLKEYKKAMMQRTFSQEIRFKDEDGKEYPEWEEKKLGNLCNITTGKLDANAMVENGEYRFYTCAKDFFRIDKYKFDTEALLISGNGANVGYIHYYNGKFNAYQRTYVLDEFAEDIIFIKWYLEQHLKKRIFEDKNEGSTPYITLSTLSEMSIILPIKQEQEKIANFLSSLDKKIQLEEEKLENYKDYKKGLMQRMFI